MHFWILGPRLGDLERVGRRSDDEAAIAAESDEGNARGGKSGWLFRGANDFANEHLRIETTVVMNSHSCDWFSSESCTWRRESSVEGHFPHAHAERPILAIWLRREIKIDRADSTLDRHISHSIAFGHSIRPTISWVFCKSGSIQTSRLHGIENQLLKKNFSDKKMNSLEGNKFLHFQFPMFGIDPAPSPKSKTAKAKVRL